jgi:hypothetical protein
MSLPSLDLLKKNDSPHPIELYRPSMDYSEFEAKVIRPFCLGTKARAALGDNIRISLTFAPGSPSFDECRQFFSETDYNRPSPSKPLPPVPRADDVPSKPLCPLRGYLSPRRADYFIWESGYFEQESTVTLGSTGRLAKVLGVGGVGRNFFMMRLEDLENPGAGEDPVRKMIVSFNPVGFHLSRLQRFKMRFFKPFLKSMRDFVDEGRVPDEVENPIAVELLAPEYVAVLENCFGALFVESSDTLVGDDSGVAQVEELV